MAKVEVSIWYFRLCFKSWFAQKKSSNIKLGIVNLAYLHTEQYCSFIVRFSDKSYSKFSISYSNHLIKTLKIHLKYVNICTPLGKKKWTGSLVLKHD